MSGTRRLIAGLVPGILACAVGGASSLPDPASAPALKSVMAEHFLVGGAIEPWQLGNAADVALLQKHFSSITAENVMKPRHIAPTPGTYDFAAADALIRFAETNSMRVRGHTLLWHKTAPDWFFEGDRSDLAAYRARVRQRLESYLTTVVAHFRGRIYAWDVVNEVASDNAGETYRETSPWHVALGPEYIEVAFRAARAADPDALLFINDYNTEQPAKRERLLTIVRDLRAKGVPLDGVGHQLHMQYGDSAAEVDRALAAVAALGLVNHVTELDISVYSDPGSCFSSKRVGCQADYGGDIPPAVMSAQATLYRQLFGVFKSHESLKSVTTWGISDGHTWLSRFPVTRTNQPLLFDTQREPKAGFWAVVDPAFVVR